LNEFKINDVNLWWPNGSGEAYLYHFKLKINGDSKNWEKDFKIGFRDIELKRERDSIGESFTFYVNHEPIYMKGANYIPQDIFPSKVKEESYREILKLSKDAHINMLRVWGGGIYEKDEFYELCDEMGILVWQDFMFACSLYPGDPVFLNNVKQEATQQIKRIRDHASLALWCGNNEMNELWYNWGYQKSYGYSAEDSTKIWHDYLRVFDTLLPQLVQQYNPQTFYLESSPVIGWGHKESMLSGDSHYWGIWWGKQPFEMYEEKIPRFSSEFGFQSLPHLNTILSFTDSSQLDLFSEDMKAHQKSSIGNQTILDYLPLYYPEPKNFQELIYISQLLQAYGMDLAFQAQRIAKPRCMGTLYWQLNDCWPGLSWSSLDYYKQKKATHYIAKKDFATFLLKTEIEDKLLKTTIVSDSLKNVNAELISIILSFNGDTIQHFKQMITVEANHVLRLDLGQINTPKLNPAKTFIKTKLIIDDKTLAESVDFLVKPKDLELTNCQLQIDSIGKNLFRVYSSPATFQYSIYLSTKEFGNFQPNFFHLLPEKSVIIKFIPNDKAKTIDIENINMHSLNNIY
jgi:beta-mannosidase